MTEPMDSNASADASSSTDDKSSRRCKSCKEKVFRNVIKCTECNSEFHGRCLRDYLEQDPPACCAQLIRSSLPRISSRVSFIYSRIRPTTSNTRPSSVPNSPIPSVIQQTTVNNTSQSIFQSSQSMPAFKNSTNQANVIVDPSADTWEPTPQQRADWTAVPPSEHFVRIMTVLSRLENRVTQNNQVIGSLLQVSEDHADQLDQHTDQLGDHETRLTNVEDSVKEIKQSKSSSSSTDDNSHLVEIIVSGIPVEATYSLIDITEAIFKNIGFNIPIASAVVNTRELKSSNNSSEPRNKTYVIECTSQSIRKRILTLRREAGTILFSSLFPEFIGSVTTAHIYLKQMLPPPVYEFYRIALPYAKAKKVRCFATSNRVFICKSRNSKPIQVNSTDDIDTNTK